MTQLLMVCLGNICRSPTAEGAVRQALARHGLTHVTVQSAGTGSHHQGDRADSRTISHAKRRGIDLDSHRARGLVPEDFVRFDYVFAMDTQNQSTLIARCPETLRSKIFMFLGDQIVPDPYYEGPDAFEHVLDLCEQGAERVVSMLKTAAR
ncbi:MAG: low molecular weight protein-tyrosine-phosphatase [Deltaproteobacteria bacterium]|nr:low molecular weight protein-tyrosine-phosphatase [Deltaproteobacteria bacterium]